MAEAAKQDVEVAAPARKRGKGLLIGGLAAMLLLGGAGFYATFSGMLALPIPGTEASAAKPRPAPGAPAAFVPVGQLTVSLGPSATARHLRLSAELEVEPGFEREVATLLPRVLDVMNTYLQALDESDLSQPAAMARMRAHMLRRIRIVTGEGRVRDLLITEFVMQ